MMTHTMTIGTDELKQITAFVTKAYKRTGVYFTTADIEEATQAAVLHVLDYAVEKFDASKSAWKTFVTTVAYRFTLDTIEKTRFHASLNKPSKRGDKGTSTGSEADQIDTLRAEDASPEARLISRDRMAQLREALAQLSDTDRYIVTTLAEDASEEACAPVCEATGLKLSAVRARLCRARAQLRDSVE